MSELIPGLPATVAPGLRPPSAKVLKARARQQLAKQSRRWQGRLLRVRYRWLDQAALATATAPVLTLAVAKKQARRAVDRNRVKRLVREWFRLAAHRERPADLLVGLAQPWRRHASEPDLLADLGDLLGILAGRETEPAGRRRGEGLPRAGHRSPPSPVAPLPALPSRPVPPVA